MTVFALADCNNFYASCERIFLPRLEGVPVVVLSNNDGCIIARSNEAKQLGIPMGAPLHEVQACIRANGVQVFSANFALYGDMSRRVMQTLGTFTEALEIYSIDEAFLDISAVPPPRRFAFASHMRQRVKRDTGIPVSVGIGPTKTLAKLANDLAKKRPAGVLEFAATPQIDAALAASSVEDIWGIGGKRAEVLRQHGISSALDLKHADLRWIKQRLHLPVLRTVYELRGVSCLALEEVHGPKKEICCSRAFGRPVTDLHELEEAAAFYAHRASERLRRQHSLAQVVTVFVHTNPFQPHQPQYANTAIVPLPHATNSTPEIIAAARQGLARIYRPGFRYHKAGVMLLDLVSDTHIQGELFPVDPAIEHQRRLMAVVDAINRRFGRETIHFLVEGIAQPWRMQQRHRSPRYTTHWDELPTVTQ